jgi:hypothetical protein
VRCGRHQTAIAQREGVSSPFSVCCVLVLIQLLWSLIVIEDVHVYSSLGVFFHRWTVVPYECDLLVSRLLFLGFGLSIRGRNSGCGSALQMKEQC